METTTITVNPYRQQLDLREQLDDAIRTAEQVQRLTKATAAMKANAWLFVTRLQEKIAAMQPVVDAYFEQLETEEMAAVDAAIAEAGAAAVETAEKILAAALQIQRRPKIEDRKVVIWLYDDDPDYPHMWNGEITTAGEAAKTIAGMNTNGKPRITRTFDGYYAFIFDAGRRVIVKGATPDELRLAWLAVAS